eukprot:gene3186-5919_t
MEVFVSEGEPTSPAHLSNLFGNDRSQIEADSNPDSMSLAKKEFLQKLFFSVACKDTTKVDLEGLFCLVKMLFAIPDGLINGHREITRDHCQRMMSIIDQSATSQLSFEDFCKALSICVNDNGKLTPFYESILVADGWALHEHILTLKEDHEKKSEAEMIEKKHLQQQLNDLRQEMFELEQQNTSVLDDTETQLILLQKENAMLKAELVRAKDFQSLHEIRSTSSLLDSQSQRSSPRSPKQHEEVDLQESADVYFMEMNQLRDSLDTVYDKVDQLERELSNERQRSSTLQDELLQTSEELREVWSHRSKAERQLATVTFDLQRVTAELNDARRSSTRFSQDFNASGHSMALGVELELDAVKTENVSLKKENNSLKTAFKEETDKLDEIRRSVERELQAVKDQLKQERKQTCLLSSKLELAQINMKTSDKKQPIKLTEDTVHRLRKELSEKDARLKITLRSLEAARETARNLRTQLYQLERNQGKNSNGDIHGKGQINGYEAASENHILPQQGKRYRESNVGGASPYSSSLKNGANLHSPATHQDKSNPEIANKQLNLEMANAMARIRRLETDKARLQETIIEHKRVEVELLAEISQQRAMLMSRTNKPARVKSRITRQNKSPLNLAVHQPSDDNFSEVFDQYESLRSQYQHCVLNHLSKVRREQQTAARQQLRDLEEINLALRGEFGSSGIVDNNTLPYQYDTFQDNLVNVAGFQEEATLHDSHINDDLSAAQQVYSFDVFCQPCNVAYDYDILGRCRLNFESTQLRIVHIETRNEISFYWESISRLVRTGNKLTFYIDRDSGEELELTIASSAVDEIAKSFSQLNN